MISRFEEKMDWAIAAIEMCLVVATCGGLLVVSYNEIANTTSAFHRLSLDQQIDRFVFKGKALIECPSLSTEGASFSSPTVHDITRHYIVSHNCSVRPGALAP